MDKNLGAVGALCLSSMLYGGEMCSYSVESLINSSLRHHPAIQSARYGVQNAQAQIEGAKWGYYPTPSVEISQSSGRNGMTIRLDQPLWTGGKLDAAVEIAQSHKNEASAALDESSYTLIETLLNVYQNYLQSYKSIQTLKEGREQLQTLSQMLDRRIEAGVSSLADRELLKSRLTQVNADLAVSIVKQQTSHAQLELLVGEKISCAIDTDHTAGFNADTAFDALIEQMIKTHPTLKKLSEQIKTAEAEKAMAKAALWPSVSLRAEQVRGSIYSDQSSTDNLVYVAVSASSGAGLSALSNIQSAEAKVFQMQSERMSKQQELTDALIRDFNDYHATKNRISTMSESIGASQNVLESYTRLFIAGKRQWLDLVNASRELTQNRLSLSDIDTSYRVLGYRLALKSGTLRFETKEKQ